MRSRASMMASQAPIRSPLRAGDRLVHGLGGGGDERIDFGNHGLGGVGRIEAACVIAQRAKLAHQAVDGAPP